MKEKVANLMTLTAHLVGLQRVTGCNRPFIGNLLLTAGRFVAPTLTKFSLGEVEIARNNQNKESKNNQRLYALGLEVITFVPAFLYALDNPWFVIPIFGFRNAMVNILWEDVNIRH
jgi:hypothetical protein